MTSVETCEDLHAGYDGQVRPWVSDMVQMSTGMDELMGEYEDNGLADYACVAASMVDELDYHDSVACTSGDLSLDQEEANRHASAMTEYSVHTWDRCEGMLSAIEGDAVSWDPVIQFCETWDGHCHAMMHAGCCGHMMHGDCP